jgi:hypothetical protein
MYCVLNRQLTAVAVVIPLMRGHCWPGQHKRNHGRPNQSQLSHSSLLLYFSIELKWPLSIDEILRDRLWVNSRIRYDDAIKFWFRDGNRHYPIAIDAPAMPFRFRPVLRRPRRLVLRERIGIQNEAGAADIANHRRLVRAIDLAPQPAHVNVDEVRLRNKFIVPNLLQKFCPRQ